jgi:hypothetical protein
MGDSTAAPVAEATGVATANGVVAGLNGVGDKVEERRTRLMAKERETVLPM